MGGLAGAIAAIVFNLAVSERILDDAVAREAAHAALEPFTRGEQHGGMVVGELLIGLAAALLLAGVALLVAPRVGSPRRTWLLLCAAFAGAMVLLPALKYPPLPPGVESSLGIDERQVAYLMLVGSGLAGAGLAAVAWKRLGWIAAAAALVVPPVLALLLLPENEAEGAGLAGFRTAAVGGEVLFWAALTVAGVLLLPRASSISGPA